MRARVSWGSVIRHICAHESLRCVVFVGAEWRELRLLFTCRCLIICVGNYRLMKASVCFVWGDLASETDRLCLREIGNERRDSIGQLEEKLRVLQVKLK